MTHDEALAEIEHMRALLEASAMLDRDKDAEIERLREAAVSAADYLVNLEDELKAKDIDMMLDEPTLPPSLVAERILSALPLSSAAIRNLPDTDGDGNATRAET